MSRHRTTAAALLVLLVTGVYAGTASAAVPRLIFPVVAKASYTDDFGAPRWQGRHEGNDLMAAKRSPVVAVEPGRVVKYTSSRAAGCMLYLYGNSGTKYMYIHLNNDRTLRNDNRGGCANGIAYAPGLRSSQQVQAGQLIGYVGDSGDANGIASHLHFELHPSGGRAVSPYRHLRAAFKHLFARPPAAVTTLSMRVEGTVVYTVTDIDPQRIRVRVTRVRLSNGWVFHPNRDIALALSPDTIYRRWTKPGVFSTASLSQFKPGLKVVAWTGDFTQNLNASRALPGLHVAADLLIRKQD
jgi:murein DD-endopeptidase MepM/ murein hydrolase activator NlpD